MRWLLVPIVIAACAVLMLARCGVCAEPWDIAADTWVATDGLGRSLPTSEEVGPPRSDRFVGMFYFLWHGRHTDQGPFDISKILAQDPMAVEKPSSPLWPPMGSMLHWGEPRFGYYRSDDEGVLRKHAQMLADSGVDVLIFDVTNHWTYPESWQALCRVFDRARREGNRVPKIAFLCPFGEPRKVVRELWEQLYSRNLYPELWFHWKGKPLIMADPDLLAEKSGSGANSVPTEVLPQHRLGRTFTAPRSFRGVGGLWATWHAVDSAATLTLYREGPQGKPLASRRIDKVVDNGWHMIALDSPLPAGTYYLELSEPKGKLGWWTSADTAIPPGQTYVDRAVEAGGRSLSLRLDDGEDGQILRFFTFRKPQPNYFQGPRGPGDWGWLEVSPQHVFYDTPGVAEEVTVGVAQNAVDGKLSVLSNPRSRGRSFHDGKQPPPNGQDTTGRNFAEQWDRALKLDPAFVFITGWNEWIASSYPGATFPVYQPTPVVFMDEFNAEYSRDIEPMLGGHGDNYYYQSIANIRRYKGVRPIPPVRPHPIVIDGRFDDWKDVEPEFRDTIGDPVHRNHPGWGKQLHYTDQTGRNDIVAAKVSYDEKNVYFYVRTRDKLTPPSDPNWMFLFVDVDSNPKTGWLGYDVVINRKAGDGATSFERNVGGTYAWTPSTTVAMRTSGREMEIAVPREQLGIRQLPATLDFKWADNLQQTGDWSDFQLHGDAAPNDRFNYRAKLGR